MRVGDRGVVGLRYGVGQQLELVLVQILGNFLRRIVDARRTNGFVGILSTRSILNPATMLRILISKSINDKASCFILSDWTNPSRIRTHIGDQTLDT